MVRTLGLATGVVLIGALCGHHVHAQGAAVADLPQAVHWLEAKSRELIRGSRREMAGGTAAFLPQAGAGYDAFWLRDYAYMLEGCPEAFSERQLREACLLFVEKLAPDGSGVDCVKLDGTAVYKPGLGTMGENPVADGGPFTVAVAWHTYQRLKDRALVERIVDRLEKTLRAVPRDRPTGLVYIRPAGYDRCPYGFMDTVRQAGDVLFCSLLLIQADRQLADLLDVVGRGEDAKALRAEAERLVPAVRRTFWDEQVGLFRAATVRCREHDVWGSAFAVYLGVASEEQAGRVARYFKQHYGEILERGQLRHLPKDEYWESARPRDEYQNGGYWATPVGWFVYTLDRVDSKMADQTVVEMVRDFQARGVTEWVRGERTAVKNYVASAALPLAGVRRMVEQRGTRGR
jgi:hypothetical protein